MARGRFARYLLLAGVVGLVAIAAATGLSAHQGPTTALAAGAVPHAPPLGSGGQISGPPTELSAGCSLLPTSWTQCIYDAFSYAANQFSNAVGAAGNATASFFTTLVQGIVLEMYDVGLSIVVSIFVSVGATIALFLDSAIDTFAIIASSLGIFAMPFLAITTVGLAGGIYLAFEALKDTPILGALE